MDNWIIEIRLSDFHGEAEHNVSWEKSKSRLHVNYISTQIPIKLTANQSINNHRDSNGSSICHRPDATSRDHKAISLPSLRTRLKRLRRRAVLVWGRAICLFLKRFPAVLTPIRLRCCLRASIDISLERPWAILLWQAAWKRNRCVRNTNHFGICEA